METQRKERVLIHAHLGGPTTGLCLSHGRTRPWRGRALLDGQTQGHNLSLAVLRRLVEGW